jgi:hypothetical protein
LRPDLAEREGQRGERCGKNDRTGDIEAAARVLVRRRVSHQQRHRDQRQRWIDGENILPAELLRQPAAKRGARGGGERRGRRPHADGAAALFLGIGCTDQCKARRRHERRRSTLRHTRRNQPFDRRREHTSRRCRAEAKTAIL